MVRKDADVNSGVMFGDVILDVSKDGRLVGIEMLDASNIIGISAENPDGIMRADMRVFYRI